MYCGKKLWYYTENYGTLIHCWENYGTTPKTVYEGKTMGHTKYL